jgi:hypothetical protein
LWVFLCAKQCTFMRFNPFSAWPRQYRVQVRLTTRVFSIHSWRRPPKPCKQWPPWPVQDATDRECKNWGYSAWVQIAKVAILSIHSWKFVFTACFAREVIAYKFTHVRASEKSVISKNWLGTVRVKGQQTWLKFFNSILVPMLCFNSFAH